MRNLLAFVAAALVTFLGLGWYLDWYKISSTPAAGGHRHVQIDLNTPKIGQDLEKGGQKVRQMLEKSAKKEAANTSEPRKEDGTGVEPKKEPGSNPAPAAKKSEPSAEPEPPTKP